MTTTTETEKMITFIEDSETIDADDLYAHYAGQIEPQTAYVALDEDGDVYTDYSGEIGNAVPAGVWHGKDLRFPVPAETNAYALNFWLREPEQMELLERIHAGNLIRWDGNNYVGRLDYDGEAAADEFRQRLDAVTGWDDSQVGQIIVCAFHDCLPENCTWSDLVRQHGNLSISDMEQAIIKAARADGIYAEPDLYGTLDALLLEHQSAAESEEEESFCDEADARGTSEELMEAISMVAHDYAECCAIWAAPTEAQMLAVWEIVTDNGIRASSDYCWGAAGSQWGKCIDGAAGTQNGQVQS